MNTYVNDITITTRLVSTRCWDCGITFGMGAEFMEQRREDQRTFYCPNGHAAYFKAGTSEKARLEQRLKWAESSNTHLRDQLDSTERSRRAYKGEVTKIKRRVGKGVCPCCQRSFANVKRHMEGQHPEFAEPTP